MVHFLTFHAYYAYLWIVNTVSKHHPIHIAAISLYDINLISILLYDMNLAAILLYNINSIAATGKIYLLRLISEYIYLMFFNNK